MAIAFFLTRPFMTLVIIVATNMQQPDTNIDAINVKPSEDIVAEIAAI